MPKLIVAEPKSPYQLDLIQAKWIEVLVDFPGIGDRLQETGDREQKLFTYTVPNELSVQPGDILSVPFGAQVVGGIAIRYIDSLPENLDASRVREVEDVITSGFFPSHYWELLNRVAQYYYTDLIAVIRMALPPGLLGRSQRRVKLKRDCLPHGAETFCSPVAQQILKLLKEQKTGDYSVQYLQRQIRGVNRGIRELIKRGWLESYLESPKTTRPKQQKLLL